MTASGLFAQGRAYGKWSYKGELFGSVGWGRLYVGRGSLGNGLDIGGGLGVRPFSGRLSGLGFEVEINRFDFGKESTRPGSGYGSTIALTGNALYHFGNSSTQFYLLAGIGGLREDYAIIGISGGFPGPYGYAGQTKVLADFGAGVRRAISAHMSVRPEFRLFNAPAIDTTFLRLSLAFSYHF